MGRSEGGPEDPSEKDQHRRRPETEEKAREESQPGRAHAGSRHRIDEHGKGADPETGNEAMDHGPAHRKDFRSVVDRMVLGVGMP